MSHDLIAVKFQLLTKKIGISTVTGKVPFLGTKVSACVDLALPFNWYINSHTYDTAELLIAFEIPKGWCLYMQPRSSTFSKRGLLIPTSVIDQDYRRGVHLQVYNMSNKAITLDEGERLVQVQLMPCQTTTWMQMDELQQTDRGGLGSTGL